MVRCFVNNVSSTRYPPPLPLPLPLPLRVANWTRPFRGNNSSGGNIYARRCALPLSPLPLRFFPRRQPSALCAHARFEKCFIAPIFPAPSIFADEKRSSSIYFTSSSSSSLFHGFVWPPLLSRTSLDSGVSFPDSMNGNEIGMKLYA